MKRIEEIFFGDSNVNNNNVDEKNIDTKDVDIKINNFSKLIYNQNSSINLTTISDKVKTLKKQGISDIKLTGCFLNNSEIEDIILLLNKNGFKLIFEFDFNCFLSLNNNLLNKIDMESNELRLRFLFDREYLINDRKNLYESLIKVKNKILEFTCVLTISKVLLKNLSKEILFINKLSPDNIIIDFPECKKGLESFYKKNIPEIDVAKPSISKIIDFCKEKNINIKSNDRHYVYMMPENLLEGYYDKKQLVEYNLSLITDLKASIIIPTCNKLEYLKKSLISLKNQTCGKDKYEVIVVDDGSTDGTKIFFEGKKILDLNLNYGLKYIYWNRLHKLEGAGPYNRVGPTRNIGVRHSSSDVIIFIDSDIVVKENFVDEHLKMHKNNDIVIGPSYREKEGYDVREGYFKIANDNLQMSDIILWELAHEGNISFKKTDFNLVNGFSDEFVYWAYEGDDIAFNLIKTHNKKIQLNRAASGIHLNHPPEYISEIQSIKGGIYNSEIMYKKYLDDSVFERFFIHENEDFKKGLCLNDSLRKEISFVKLMTLCVEVRKCKKIDICKCQPNVIKIFEKLKDYTFFFRNDDVFELTKKLQRLITLFLNYKVPINLEVIPNKITKEFLDFIIELKQQHGRLISINQHGFNHDHIEDDNWHNGVPYEFGSDQSYDYQYEKIKLGKEIMQKEFGEYFKPVFTPPYHSFNDKTIKILEDLDFKIFSSDIHEDFTLMQNISIDIDIVEKYYPNKVSKTENVILHELMLSLKNKSNKRIGIVLHHEKMDDYDFKVIERLLKLMKLGDNNFLSFDDEFKNVLNDDIVDETVDEINMIKNIPEGIDINSIYVVVNEISDFKLKQLLRKTENSKIKFLILETIELIDNTKTLLEIYRSKPKELMLSQDFFLKIIKLLESKGIIIKPRDIFNNLNKGKVIENIEFIEVRLTDLCNLSCSMCMIKDCLGGKSFDFNLLKDNLLKLSNEKVQYIAFSGGEPLLYPKIKEILEYCCEIGIKIILITNGTLITEDNVKFLLKHCSLIRVSFDCYKKDINDKIRSPGSYNNIIRAFGLFEKYKKDFDCEIRTNTVLQDMNVDYIEEHIDYLESLSVDGYEFDLIIPSTKFKKFKSFTNDFLSGKNKALLKILESSKDSGLAFLSNPFVLKFFINQDDYQKVIVDYNTNNPSPCFLGFSEGLNFSPDGLIYPCCSTYDNSKNIIGKIDDIDRIEIEKIKYLKNNSDKCHGCVHSFYFDKWHNTKGNKKIEQPAKMYCKDLSQRDIIQLILFNKKIFKEKIVFYNIKKSVNKNDIKVFAEKQGFVEVFFIE